MDIFKKLFTTIEEKAVRLPVIQNQLIHQNRFSLGSNKGDDQFLKEYKNWVYACVTARAEELASIELVLKNKNGETVENHEILTLLNDVNPNTTKYDLFFGTQSYLDLTGNAYWFLARENEGRGAIKQIYLLPAHKMSIVLSKDNPLVIQGYLYKNGKSQIPFDANEILHFKSFNPRGDHPNPHTGIGIVEAALWAIDSDNEARNWNYSFFKNSARPDGVLSTETTMTDDQYKRVKDSWTQTYGGSNNNGKTAILEGGLKWQEISKAQKDMDFVAQRTFSRDEILSLFRVPKTVLGITDDVNRANAEATDYVFARRTVKPMMKRFTVFLNEFLVSEFDASLHFDFVDPVPEDRLATIQEYSFGVNKWLTRNDIRRREGLQESDNGDTFFGSLAEIPQDTVTVVKSVEKPAYKAQTAVDKTVADYIAKLPTVKSVEERRITPAQKSVYKELYLKRFDENEKALKDAVTKLFDDQLEEVLDNLETEYVGLKPKEYVLKGVEDVLFDEKRAVSASISLITPFIRKFLAEGAELADSMTGGTFNLNNTDTLTYIAERAKFFADSVNGTTSEALLASLKDGIDTGESFNELKARVEKVYEDATEYRVERIVRTEVSASLNQGSVDAYKQAGITKLEWVAITDDRTSDECLANDGEVRTIGDEYPAGATQPPQHVNCRCTAVAVFED